MSRHLFGKPAKQLTLAECALDRRAGARAGGAVAVDQSRRRGRPQPRRAARACARRDSSPRRRSRRRGARASAIRPYPGRDRCARRLREGIPAAAVPRSSSAATIRPTGTCGRRSCRSCRTMAERAVADGLRRFGEPELQAALVAHRSARPATSWRSSAAATSAQSQFNRAARSRRQPGSAFKPLLYAAALEHGYSPVSVLEGLGEHRAAGARRVGAAQRQRRDARRADAARGAARIEQPRRDAAAAADRIASGAAARVATSGCDDLPDVPSLSLGTGLVTPLDLTAAFAMFPERRPRGAAARHRPRHRRRRRHGVRQPAAAASA